MFAGDCKEKLVILPLEDCGEIQKADGIADLILSHASSVSTEAKTDAFTVISELMLEIENAGENSYVQTAIADRQLALLESQQTQEFRFMDTPIACCHSKQADQSSKYFEVQYQLEELLRTKCRLYNSAIYVITSGQMPEKSIVEMESSEKERILKQVGNSGFICLHTMHKGPTTSQGPNRAVLCVLAQHSSGLENNGRWMHLGMAVMHILNQHNSVGSFKIHTLRIKNQQGIEPTSWHCFLNGMSSKAEQESIGRILAPRAICLRHQ
jgi:hypothetical protein